MGLFSKFKEPSPEEKAAQEENQKLLDQFEMTKAWGVKKYATAMQFIFDKDHRWFVVVEGPEDTFKDRHPYVISFDQVTSVSIEVQENWSEEGGEFAPKGFGILTQDRYSQVFWRYDVKMTIRTTHPFAKEIVFPMNFKTTVLKLPARTLFVRRGLEIGGVYDASQIPALAEKLEAMIGKEEQNIKRENVVNVITNKDPEGVDGKLMKAFNDDRLLAKIDKILAHVKRAERICKLLDQ